MSTPRIGGDPMEDFNWEHYRQAHSVGAWLLYARLRRYKEALEAFGDGGRPNGRPRERRGLLATLRNWLTGEG